MPNTEKTSNQPAPTQKPIIDSSPSVSVNTPVNNPQANNKSNPNMVMALALCFMLIIGLIFVFVFNSNIGTDGEGKLTELNEKKKLQRMIDAEKGGATPDSRVSEAVLEGRISAILESAHAIQSDFESIKVGYKGAKEKLLQTENQVKGNMNTISRLGSVDRADP